MLVKGVRFKECDDFPLFSPLHPYFNMHTHTHPDPVSSEEGDGLYVEDEERNTNKFKYLAMSNVHATLEELTHP